MQRFLLPIAVLTLSASSLALASEAQTYTLQKTNNGYVRTNTSTGETSICTQTRDQLVCRLAADDLQAFEADLSTLLSKVGSLEKRLSALEKTGKPDPMSEPLATIEQNFENSLNQMEQFFRRFMGIVKEFQTSGELEKPVPDRT